MVHRSRARSSSLFLMELILAILFFSVASAVCVEFFVKSHLMSLDSEALTHAVNECSGAAEILCASESPAEGIELLRGLCPEGDYPELSDTERAGRIEAFLYYDDGYLPCGQESAAYVMEVCLMQEEQMAEITIEMLRRDETGEQEESVYRLETKHHIARRTAFDER